MRMKDTETKEEKAMRLSAVDQEQYKTVLKAMPKIILLLIVCICMFLYTENNEKNKTLGNPYECSDCKDFGRACKEHKEFSAEDSIKLKIKDSIENYKYFLGEEFDGEYKYQLYNEKWFNESCDFCNKQKEECTGCEYNRVAILKYLTEAIKENDDSFCENCKGLGYPSCNADKQSLVEKVYKKINE